LEHFRTKLARSLLAVTLLASCSNTVTVNGTVVDEYGVPFGGQTVLISSGAFNESTVSGASGAFTMANVPTPYNATIPNSSLLQAGSCPIAVEYVGLTRNDPTLTDVSLGLGSNRGATLGGQLTGGKYPEPSGYVTDLVIASPQISLAQNLGDQSSGVYLTTVNWQGPTSTSVTLYALQIQNDADSGLPVAYPGYGTLGGVMLQDGANFATQDVSLDPVSMATLSGSVNLPSGYTVFSKSVALLAFPGVVLPLLGDGSNSASFSYAMPTIPSTSLLVGVTAASSNPPGLGFAQKVLMAGQDETLSVPAAPSLLLPEDGVTGVTSATQFSWTQFLGGIHVLAVLPVSSNCSESVFVFTAATAANIPDLSNAGLRMLPDTNYSWFVNGIAPVATIDALASPGAFATLNFGNLQQADSASQSFTTSP
jgi:hypothetical protein